MKNNITRLGLRGLQMSFSTEKEIYDDRAEVHNFPRSQIAKLLGINYNTRISLEDMNTVICAREQIFSEFIVDTNMERVK